MVLLNCCCWQVQRELRSNLLSVKIQSAFLRVNRTTSGGFGLESLSQCSSACFIPKDAHIESIDYSLYWSLSVPCQACGHHLYLFNALPFHACHVSLGFPAPSHQQTGLNRLPEVPVPHHPDHTHPDRAFEGRSEVPPSRIRAAQGLQLQVLLLGAFLLTRRDRPAYRFGPENGRAGCHVAELNGVSLTWQLMVDMTYLLGTTFLYTL